MGSQLNKTIGEYIGELSYEEDRSQLFLPCETKKEAMMNIVICDKRGKSVCKKTVHLNVGKSLVSLDCSSIKEGQYNAWIEVNGKTYLRHLSVLGSPSEPDLLSRIKKWM